MGDVDLPASMQLDYQPRLVGPFPGEIGLIACGEITEHHLEAYRRLGYPVRILCDVDRNKAATRRDRYFPAAEVATDYRAVIEHPAVTIVDVATHPDVRSPIIQAALQAGKHVLSQKPFVEDLTEGARLVELARQQNCRLAVNQNARWAPHFSYARRAVAAGLVGRVNSLRFQIHWDHTWTRNTKFAEIHHLLLYDFAIHWFDLIVAMMPDRPWRSIAAQVAATAGQNMSPPLLAQVGIQFDDAQASLCLNGDVPFLPLNETYIAGSAGSIHSVGPDYSDQTLVIANSQGRFSVPLRGGWFPDGFGGAMTELANSLLEDREPEHSAESNLQSLRLCFAVLDAADRTTSVHSLTTLE